MTCPHDDTETYSAGDSLSPHVLVRCRACGQDVTHTPRWRHKLVAYSIRVRGVKYQGFAPIGTSMLALFPELRHVSFREATISWE